MTDESRPDEEYEPVNGDPDHPIELLPEPETPPVDADPADWADQQREVPLDDDLHDEAEA